MKITIEPTEEHAIPCPTVNLTVPDDDLSVIEVLELIKCALLAWGFHPDTVKDAFDP